MEITLSLLLVSWIAYLCLLFLSKNPEAVGERIYGFADLTSGRGATKMRISVTSFFAPWQKPSIKSPTTGHDISATSVNPEATPKESVTTGNIGSQSREPDVTPTAEPLSSSSPPEVSKPEDSVSSEDRGKEKTKLALITSAQPSTIPLPAIPKAAPQPGMQLKLRRAQRSGVMGRVIFTLDARIEPSPEQLALIRKYGLGKMIVYDSEARKRHAAAADEHLSAAAGTASATPLSGMGIATSIGSSLWRVSRGAVRAAAMALSLRCTIDSLIAGQHIECKDLNELLGAESAIKDACETTIAFVDVALTFDGREEVLEF